MSDRFAPILPSRDYDVTAAFFAKLGFEMIRRTEPPDFAWMILARGDLWFHFYPSDHDPAKSSVMVYLHLDDPDIWDAAFRKVGFPDAGIPRVTTIKDEDWGMREFAIVDPDGSLIRVGRPLETVG